MKITLKKNKMIGGMNTSLKAPKQIVKGSSLNLLPPPPTSSVIGASLKKRKAVAKEAVPPNPPMQSISTQSISLNDEPALPAEMLPYTLSIKELLNNEADVNGPLHELLKTYKNRQLYNLINISYSNLSALLNILIVYLDNIGIIAYSNTSNDQPFKLQLKDTLKELLNTINEFKINNLPINNTIINPINAQLSSIVYDTTKNPFSYYTKDVFNTEMFNPENNNERYFKDYSYEHIINNISNIINESNIIFNKLLTNNIFEIIPTITENENKNILENNIIILIYTQLISYKFIQLSTDNKLLNISSQNTYNTSKKIHSQIYKILQNTL